MFEHEDEYELSTGHLVDIYEIISKKGFKINRLNLKHLVYQCKKRTQTRAFWEGTLDLSGELWRGVSQERDTLGNTATVQLTVMRSGTHILSTGIPEG